ncbi:MAG: siderophore ABC transporter substrate-binding protein [Actinomycetales bacterium]
MQRIALPGLVLSVLVASLAGCGASDQAQAAAESTQPAATVTVSDAQGRTVEVPVNPEVVVATDWSVIRTLTDLGIEVDAVPQSPGALPEDLQQYADGGQAAIVGTLFEPDYEAINALEPDLIIVGSRTGTPEVVAEMEKITPHVVDLSTRFDATTEQIPATRTRVEQLGEIFDKHDDAIDLMDAVDTDVAATAEQVTADGSTAAFVQVSGGTVSAYGPGSRFGIVYDVFGYRDTGAAVDPTADHGAEVSQEFFQQYNPGALLVLDRAATIGSEGEASAMQVLDNDLVTTTDAARNDRIQVVDGFSWYIAPAAPTSLTQISSDVRASL